MIHCLHGLNGHAIIVHDFVRVVWRTVASLALFSAKFAPVESVRLRMTPIKRTIVARVISHLGGVHVVIVYQCALAQKWQQRVQSGLLIWL